MEQYTERDSLLEKCFDFHPSETDTLLEKGFPPRPLSKDGDGKKPLYKLQDWMSNLDDALPLSALSIPGTHDSCAYTTTWPFISTQNLDLKQQLYAGIRYFDFRCGLINDELQMVHGRATLGLPLSEVLSIIYDWLAKHPTEAVVVQLKQDRKSENSTTTFSKAVMAIIAENQKYWRTFCTTPRLGEVRGRIQLLRRFSGDRLRRFGVDVTRWQDNPERPFTIYNLHPPSILTIQDHYTSSSHQNLSNLIASKGGDISTMLAAAVSDPDPWHWYINFTSAFEFNYVYQINPRQIALGAYSYFRWVDGINIRLFGSLKMEPGKKRLGVVVMDFPELPETELVELVVNSNFETYEEPPEMSMSRGVKGLLIWVLLVVWLLLAMLLCFMLGQYFVYGRRVCDVASWRSFYDTCVA